MNKENVCTDLAALYKQKAAEGLIDVKFLVSNFEGVPKEVIFAEALRFEEAVANGDVEPLDFNDRHYR